MEANLARTADLNKICPLIPLGMLTRQFVIDNTSIEVTSLDIAMHGSFLMAGCSNGAILFFDISSTSDQIGGLLVGHIRAKGLHTNLLLTVRITEDCRFCFAGVMKGSSEMMAIDLQTVDVAWDKWPSKTKKGYVPVSANEQSALYASGLDTFSHADPKLRGFGSVALVKKDGGAPVYRLACGRGIKNVHVWQFTPPSAARSAPEWVCIYDVASNGNTITTVGFRNGGMELLSKSAGVNIRMWDISKYGCDTKGSDSFPHNCKPGFEDVSNSQDVKCLQSGGFAFGGTYDFAVIKIDAPREANRDSFEMPERASATAEEEQYSAGLRRRRTMREIEDVICTDDGEHVLALCADGGVMYYHGGHHVSSTIGALPREVKVEECRFVTPDSDRVAQLDADTVLEVCSVALAPASKLVELTCIQRTPEEDQAWAIRRVGRHGHVVLARVSRCKSSPGKNSTFISISLDLLSNICKQDRLRMGEVFSTEIVQQSTPVSVGAAVMGKGFGGYDALFPSGTAVRNIKRKLDSAGEELPNITVTCSSPTDVAVSGIGLSGPRSKKGVSPCDPILRLVSAPSPTAESTIPTTNVRQNLHVVEKKNGTRVKSQLPPRHPCPVTAEVVINDKHETVTDVSLLYIDQYPAFVQRYEPSMAVHPAILVPVGKDFVEIWIEADKHFAAWQNLLDEILFPPSESKSLSLGPNEMSRLSIIRREHRQIFICFHRAIGDRYLSFRSCPSLHGADMIRYNQVTRFSLDSLIIRTKCLLIDLLQRQQLELRGARAMDSIRSDFTARGLEGRSSQLHFCYTEMFSRAETFQEGINLCLVDLWR